MDKRKNKKYPIDAVILWVDSNDVNHQKKMEKHLGLDSKSNTKKYIKRHEQINEIKYTVDSIIKFAPFFENIYIVTDNQVPDFLNVESSKYEKVKIIDHTKIFKGFEEMLPTFNCRSIESCIYRIPNLAEHFVYFNDDFFLINKTNRSDFFKNGYPILRGKWKKFDENIWYKKFKKPKYGHKYAQQQAAKFIGFDKYYNFRHTPHPLRKSTFEIFFNNNQDVFINNIKYKLRSKNQFTPQGLANHIEILNHTCYFKKDLQLLYFRSYKKPLFWYKYKFKKAKRTKLFLGLQGLNLCPPKIQKFIFDWLSNQLK